MALWNRPGPGKLSADKLEKRLGNLDLPLDETWNDCIEALELPAREHWRALGTIGGGNPLRRTQQVETVRPGRPARHSASMPIACNCWS